MKVGLNLSAAFATAFAVAAMFAGLAIANAGSAVPNGVTARTEARTFADADGSVFRYR